MLKSYRDKNERTHRSGEGCPLCEPGSELRKGGNWRRRANTLDREKKRGEKQPEQSDTRTWIEKAGLVSNRRQNRAFLYCSKRAYSIPTFSIEQYDLRIPSKNSTYVFDGVSGSDCSLEKKLKPTASLTSLQK